MYDKEDRAPAGKEKSSLLFVLPKRLAASKGVSVSSRVQIQGRSVLDSERAIIFTCSISDLNGCTIATCSTIPKDTEFNILERCEWNSFDYGRRKNRK